MVGVRSLDTVRLDDYRGALHLSDATVAPQAGGV
jgi:hypothetical protein